jgi:tetratricopeptide (TPR) repeat protein
MTKPKTQRHEFPGLDAALGPARPLSARDVEWLVEQAVERALTPAQKRPPRLLSLRALSLAALAIVTSAAAATVVHQVRKSVVLSESSVSAPQQQSPKKKNLRASSPHNEGVRDVAPNADIVQTPPEVTAPSPTPQSVTPRPVSLEDQLSAANELRRKADWQAAEAAYRQVAARYPQLQEGYVAKLAAAELRLYHLGDTQGALRLYQSVPRDNPLGVEALYGVSHAYRALGDREAEKAALRSLIESYPTSLQADGARTRLTQLEKTEVP